MLPNIELLVHIGAPSARRDDEIYTAQARAYLGFESNLATHHYCKPVEHNLKRTREDVDISDDEEPPLEQEDLPLYLDDTQLAYNALESQLATSSLIIPSDSPEEDESQVSSPHVNPNAKGTKQLSKTNARFRVTSSYLQSKHDDHAIHQEDLYETNGGHAISKEDREQPTFHPAGSSFENQTHDNRYSQSSYLKSPILDRSSKKRRLSGSHLPSSQAARYIALREDEHLGLAYVGERPVINTERLNDDDRYQSRESQADNDTTSELPTSYSLSDITSESSRAKARRDASQRSVSDPGPQTAGARSDASQLSSKPNLREAPEASGVADRPSTLLRKSGTRSQNAPSPLQRNNVTTKDQDDAQPNNETSSRTKTPAPNKERENSPSSEPEGALNAILHSLPKSIHPPSPPTAQTPYTTHITPSLHFLASRLDVEKAYKPVSVSRELQPLERGYWVVECGAWELGAQVEFWEFLGRVVGRGDCGWGVWCTRGEDEDDGGGGGGVQGTLGTVKIFCWGEVVRHVYLLLYVASKSHVRKLGLRWVDSGGEVVVQMRGG